MKLLPWILLIAALIYIGWQCNSSHPSVIDTHTIDSLAKAKDSTIALYKDSVVILQLKIGANDIDRNREIASKEELEKRMTNKIMQLTFSLNKFRTAKEGHDTVQQLINCNDIVNAFDSIYAQALIYKITIDSLQANGTERRGIDSTGIAMRDRTIADLTSQINALQKLLTDAVKDNADLRVALKRSKRGRWILAGLGVLVGGLIVNQVK